MRASFLTHHLLATSNIIITRSSGDVGVNQSVDIKLQSDLGVDELDGIHTGNRVLVEALEVDRFEQNVQKRR